MSIRLFDPADTEPRSCPVRGCSAMLTLGQRQTPTCLYDRRAIDDMRRPKGCLNAYDPATSDMPH